MPLIATSGGTNMGVVKPPKPLKPATPISMMPRAGELGAAQGEPGGAPLPKPPTPVQPQLDGTAIANIAAYLNKAGGTISNDQLGITNYQTQLQNAIAQDQQNNQMANLKLMTGENASGGLYGSAYGQQLGNQNAAYGTKESDATSTANMNIGKLTDAIAALQSSEPIYASGQAAASTARATTAAAKDAPVPVKPVTPLTPLQKATNAAKSIRTNLNPTNKPLTTSKRTTGTPMGGLR